MQNYVVTYLLPRIEQANAVEERGQPGLYRHEVLVAARRDTDVISDLRARGGVPLSIAAVPMYQPMAQRASVNKLAVTKAPSHTCRHGTRALGRNRNSIAKSATERTLATRPCKTLAANCHS